MSQFGSRARAFFDRAFPERQIYHRSGGTVRYVSLSPGKQALLALTAVGLAGWCVYASANTLLEGPQASASNAEVERERAKYDRWLNESRAQAAASQALLEERTRQFDRATQDFESRHEVLRSLLEYAGGNGVQLAATRPIERDGARIIMAASIDEAEPRQSRAVTSEPYQVTTVGFRARTRDLEADQEQTLSELEDSVVEQSETVRGVLRLTGVSMTSLTGSDEVESGGPLVPQDFVAYLRDSGLNPAFAERVAQVAARVTESRRLGDIANSTPLAPPVAVDYRETSGYGARVDPFTGRPAFHSGLDLAAFERAPVVATSPGTVVYAGTRAGYGYTVEIDHGHGFKTRYAHLRDIQVRTGERVAIGQRVGSMGSTGRSTATHLHYEVWFRGRAVDPISFLRAGRHVHEQG
ncbi:peptidoglycan DD-metalloendopeptidase family protein [Terricaulis sp.]|jgi:murein DD-endopeptidase MepM/ murein hydrolase activator NlpD|uniref:peptidoglycan DD-metalloendopeptidase family protein n=1 Tax=Terricaulis sp. TaxID=2768686 RepID=UPI000ADFABD6|nr:peptidoglycan DD-metalloendopeptidase family protein [Terricaulis sp.]MDZ4692824.1 peptidoglycan DD-metalloendopeptidase family protein [Terricaulis sp.]